MSNSRRPSLRPPQRVVRRRIPRSGALVALVVALVAAGCSSGHHDAAPTSAVTTTVRPTTPPTTPPPTTTAPPTTAPTTTAPPTTPPPTKPKPKPKPVNPLTGLGPKPTGPVIAVKIDNTSKAFPQANVNSADLVYVEQVEGGLSRLIAIYAGQYPTSVGPVRSVRFNDPELLQQFGKIGLAFSGGAAAVVNFVHQSPLVDGSANTHGGSYSRSSSRPGTYNLMLNLQTLASSLKGHAAGVKALGLTWADQYGPLAKAQSVGSIRAYVGNTPISFSWDAASKKWIRKVNGDVLRQSNGNAVATPNVIVQFGSVHTDYRDVDTAGNPSVYTDTIGKGKALIFRNGKVFSATWSRPSANASTHYVDSKGKDIPLQPGGAWVLLAANGSSVAY